MIVAGIILTFAGLVGTLWAHNVQQSFEYSWYSMWGSSDYEYVDVLYYVSIPVLFLGVILLMVGCIKYFSSTNNHSSVITDSDIEKKVYVENNINNSKVECAYCKSVLDSNAVFCPYCGEKCRENGKEVAFCSNCGTRINSGKVFCSCCGNKVQR